MTDTPRTEAELLSIFADNNTGAITPQDMRDAVKSVPAGPLYQKAAYTLIYKDDSALLTLVNGGSGFGTLKVFPWRANRPAGSTALVFGKDFGDDSYSKAGSDSDSAYGIDVDAGNAFLLPPGLWLADLRATVAITEAMAVDSGPWPPFEVIFDQTEYDPHFIANGGVQDGTEPFWYSRFGNPVTWILGSFEAVGNARTERSVHIQESVLNDTSTSKPFALYGYTMPDRATDVHLSSWLISFARIA